MTRTKDIIFTVLFVACFSYYSLLGLAFGGLSNEDHSIYVVVTVTGLIFIILSIFRKSKKGYLLTRLLGLLLVPALIVFDIRNSFMPAIGTEQLIDVITYLPFIIFLFFTACSIARAITVLKQKSANTGLVK